MFMSLEQDRSVDDGKGGVVPQKQCFGIAGGQGDGCSPVIFVAGGIQRLHAGVFRSHVINGKTPHSLLIELLTDKGIGTTMHSTEEALKYDEHPLGTLASRLAVNN